jgi:hypothetical protein
MEFLVGYSRSLELKDLTFVLDPWSTAFCSVLNWTVYTILHKVRFSDFAYEAVGCFVFLTGLFCYIFLRPFLSLFLIRGRMLVRRGSIGQGIWTKWPDRVPNGIPERNSLSEPTALFWLKYSFYSFFAMIVLQIPRPQLPPLSYPSAYLSYRAQLLKRQILQQTI